MRRAATVLVPALASVLFGCPEGSSDGMQPFRDDWETVLQTGFDYLDDDGVTPLIAEVIVGGTAVDKNFANRGDVTVKFDGPADQITIELRRFTFLNTQSEAEEAYDKLNLWTYKGTGDPKRPAEMDADDDCQPAWDEGCRIFVYYDGQIEPIRQGADIRVTLPAEYRHSVSVTTSDAIADDEYLNRGNVCLQNVAGSVNASLESGEAFAIVADGVQPVPTCAAADIATCEMDGWVATCPCGTDYGRLVVSGRGTSSANVTIDVPQGVWAHFDLENQGTQSEAEEHCTATISHPENVEEPQQFPWLARGDANYPGDPAIAGGGYSVRGESANCAPVSFTENPDQFGMEQMSELRGNLEICAGCLRGSSCEDLLP